LKVVGITVFIVLALMIGMAIVVSQLKGEVGPPRWNNTKALNRLP